MLGLYYVVWVGIILSVLQQFVGINVSFYYFVLMAVSLDLMVSAAVVATLPDRRHLY